MTYKLPAPIRLPSNGYNTVAGYSAKQMRQAYAEGLAAQIPDNPCLNDYVDKTIRAHMAKLEAEAYCWLYKDDMGDVQIFFVEPPAYSKPLFVAPPDTEALRKELDDALKDRVALAMAIAAKGARE